MDYERDIKDLKERIADLEGRVQGLPDAIANQMTKAFSSPLMASQSQGDTSLAQQEHL